MSTAPPPTRSPYVNPGKPSSLFFAFPPGASIQSDGTRANTTAGGTYPDDEIDDDGYATAVGIRQTPYNPGESSSRVEQPYDEGMSTCNI